VLKVIVTGSAKGKALTLAVQDRYPAAWPDTGTDTANRNIDELLKLFDTRAIASPGTKEKFVVFATSEGVSCPIMSSQGAVRCRQR
jgi:hypothetical protein